MAGRTFIDIVARVYRNAGEASSEEYRAMAIEGQGEIPTDQRIAFTRPAGVGHGSLIRIAFVTEARRNGGGSFLVARGNRRGQRLDILARSFEEAEAWLSTNRPSGS